MTNEEFKEVLELSKRKDSLMNQISNFHSNVDIIMGNSCLSKYIQVTDPKEFLKRMRNDILEEIKNINSKIDFITRGKQKEVEMLYTKRESLLRDLDLADTYLEEDDIVATIGLGIGEREFIEINDPKSVLRLIRNNLLIEINDINKQIDKI